MNNYCGLSQSISVKISNFLTGVTILSLSASDEDDSPNNKKIEFSIIGGDPQGMFSMENQEANIGSIVLKKVLDRETTDSYQLMVMAADGGTPSRNTTAVVSLSSVIAKLELA